MTIDMAEDHQLRVANERDPERPGRYRWVLLRAGEARVRSFETYATRREAEAESAIALAKHIAAWRARRSFDG